jgi:hypothetical protein
MVQFLNFCIIYFAGLCLTWAQTTGANNGLDDLKSDKTGTNPVNFQQDVQITNENLFFPQANYTNISKFTYRYAIKNNLNVVLKAPFLQTDTIGGLQSGLGDVALRTNWIPYFTGKQAVMVGLEASFDTASKDHLGTGKNVLSPIAVWAFFLESGWIFAPAYQHFSSISGDDNRRDVDSGAVDFYLVKAFNSHKNWITIDPSYVLNYELDHSSMNLEVEIGQVLGPMWNEGVGSAFFNPGISIGADREYNWKLEIGFKIVGI